MKRKEELVAQFAGNIMQIKGNNNITHKNSFIPEGTHFDLISAFTCQSRQILLHEKIQSAELSWCQRIFLDEDHIMREISMSCCGIHSSPVAQHQEFV